MWTEHLTSDQENQILGKLAQIARGTGSVSARELKKHEFARWLATLLNKDVGYESSLQSRVLQVLRDKGRITMSRGLYIISG